MPKSPKVIRRRITSVRKTQQITKAMKMVAAAKLRRAQDRALRYRPYAEAIERIMYRLVLRMRQVAQDPHSKEHRPLPQWAQPELPGPVTLIVVASERGLCGSFNTNVLRTAEHWLRDHAGKVASTITVGRKARDYFHRRHLSVSTALGGHVPAVDDWVRQLREEAMKSLSERSGAVHVAFNHLVTLTTQKPAIVPFLPVSVPDAFKDETVPAWITEPGLFGLAEEFLATFIECRLRNMLYESEAGEHAARMAAMENATKSAREMIDRLTMEMNKARQAAITKELMDIVNGAEALCG